MHGHETSGLEVLDGTGIIALVFIVGMVLFMVGVLPVPVGIERGKVKYLKWCGTGMHPMIVYWDDEYGFQTLHPKDKTK